MNENLAKSTDYKLTKRHIMNERARLAQQLCKVNDRMIAIGLGEVDNASPAQVQALKAIQNKLLSDISPEDLEIATGEKSTKEKWDELADFIKNQGEIARKELMERGVLIQSERKLEAVI